MWVISGLVRLLPMKKLDAPTQESSKFEREKRVVKGRQIEREREREEGTL